MSRLDKSFSEMSPLEREDWASSVSQMEIKLAQDILRSHNPLQDKRIELQRIIHVYKKELMTPEQIYLTRQREFSHQEADDYLTWLENFYEMSGRAKVIVNAAA